MGNNAVVVVLTDTLHEIVRNSDRFVRDLDEAICRVYTGRREAHKKMWDETLTGSAKVVSCTHADVCQIVAVQGNTGVLLENLYIDAEYDRENATYDDNTKIKILKQMAERLGYRVVKKPLRQVRGKGLHFAKLGEAEGICAKEVETAAAK